MCVTVAGFGEGELARRPSLVPEDTRRQPPPPSTANLLFSATGCRDVMVNYVVKTSPPTEDYHKESEFFFSDAFMFFSPLKKNLCLYNL